jgi:hypothetical protein
MTFTLQWIGVILIAMAIDLLVRFGGSADFTRVLWAEAFLFPLTGLALHLVFRSHPRPSALRRTLQGVLVWAFLLAGLRAGIWAAGSSVALANLVVFLVALFAWLGSRFARRRRGLAPADSRTLDRQETVRRDHHG